MLRNYILTSLRNMKRYRVFTLINVAGLSIGLSICMLIIMTVSHQMKADRFNTNASRTFRIITERVNNPGMFRDYATCPLPYAQALSENLTAVEETIRIRRGFGNSWVGDLEDPTIPLSGYFVDPGFIDFFQFEMASGDPETALSEPFSVVLTEKAAMKVFGETDVIGRELDMDESGLYRVTGILKDIDQVTHLSFEGLASMSTVPSLEADSLFTGLLDVWNNSTGGWVYLRLQENADTKQVEDYMQDLSDQHMGEEENAAYDFRLQGLTSIKPGPLMGNEIGPFMPWLFVYILGGLGLIIMGSSCFNYINLTIARSLSRSREVGIRKVSGASRWQVFGQFIVESILMSFVALLLGIVLLLFLEPAFSQLNFARILQWELSKDWWVWCVVIGFTLLTGLIAGIFPALTLSSFQPVSIFRDLNRVKIFSRVFLRKALLVMQFSISLIFIISVVLLYSQVQMMMNADFGFDSRQVLTVPYDEDTYGPLRNELETNAMFSDITAVSHIPVSGNVYGNTLKRRPSDEDNGMNYFAAEPGYLQSLGIELIAGRDMAPRTEGSTESEVLLNEEAVKSLGFSSNSEALGSLVYTDDTTALNIVGIFPNYHHEALVLGIAPLAIRNIPDNFHFVQMRVAPGNEQEARETARQIWVKHNPNKALKVRFINEYIEEFYDIMFGDLTNILLVITVIACFVASLGLLGIVIFTTEKKVKEISIRKVMGAADMHLFSFLSREFIILVGIAVLIALPASFFLNALWLEQMAYRIDMSPWYFILSAALMLIIALITVGSQVLRVIRVNPAVTLRNE